MASKVERKNIVLDEHVGDIAAISACPAAQDTKDAAAPMPAPATRVTTACQRCITLSHRFAAHGVPSLDSLGEWTDEWPKWHCTSVLFLSLMLSPPIECPVHPSRLLVGPFS